MDLLVRNNSSFLQNIDRYKINQRTAVSSIVASAADAHVYADVLSKKYPSVSQ